MPPMPTINLNFTHQIGSPYHAYNLIATYLFSRLFIFYMAIRMISAFFFAVLLTGFTDYAKADLKGNLIVEVDKIKNQQGELCYKLFSGSQGFPYSNESAIKRQCVKISNNSLIITLNNIPSGSYALSIYHDLNGDRKLNRNSLGMPSEGFGFSNNPVVRNAPPNYGDCLFLVAGNTNIKINMDYSLAK